MTFICFPTSGWFLAIIIPCTISGCCCCYVRCVEQEIERQKHAWKSPCDIKMTK